MRAASTVRAISRRVASAACFRASRPSRVARLVSSALATSSGRRAVDVSLLTMPPGSDDANLVPRASLRKCSGAPYEPELTSLRGIIGSVAGQRVCRLGAEVCRTAKRVAESGPIDDRHRPMLRPAPIRFEERLPTSDMRVMKPELKPNHSAFRTGRHRSSPTGVRTGSTERCARPARSSVGPTSASGRLSS